MYKNGDLEAYVQDILTDYSLTCLSMLTVILITWTVWIPVKRGLANLFPWLTMLVFKNNHNFPTVWLVQNCWWCLLSNFSSFKIFSLVKCMFWRQQNILELGRIFRFRHALLIPYSPWKKYTALSLAAQCIWLSYRFYSNLKDIFEYIDLLRDWKWTTHY